MEYGFYMHGHEDDDDGSCLPALTKQASSCSLADRALAAAAFFSPPVPSPFSPELLTKGAAEKLVDNMWEAVQVGGVCATPV